MEHDYGHTMEKTDQLGPLTYIGQELERLGSAIDHLEVRLGDVLRPSVPSPELAQIGSPDSTIAKLRDGLSENIGRLLRITERIDL